MHVARARVCITGVKYRVQYSRRVAKMALAPLCLPFFLSLSRSVCLSLPVKSGREREGHCPPPPLSPSLWIIERSETAHAYVYTHTHVHIRGWCTMLSIQIPMLHTHGKTVNARARNLWKPAVVNIVHTATKTRALSVPHSKAARIIHRDCLRSVKELLDYQRFA